jgi:hypothetical protein
VRAKMDEKVLFAPKLSQIWPLPALSHWHWLLWQWLISDRRHVTVELIKIVQYQCWVPQRNMMNGTQEWSWQTNCICLSKALDPAPNMGQTQASY